jgi:2-polyprenyl-6-methoxyphenol hydroxylase-like FAD-dependent oxidoreductase
MDAQVIIIGGGPVGLLLGNMLGSLGISTLILEKKKTRKPGSRAIGISPPSLDILRSVGLDARFSAEGIRATGGKVHDTVVLGAARVRSLPSRYQYVLSLPQSKTEAILEESLARFDCVTLLRGHEMVEVLRGQDAVTVTARFTGANGEQNHTFTAPFVCACDGERSIGRKQAGIEFKGNYYRPTFAMGDYIDRSPYGEDAHMWFTRRGTVESFPIGVHPVRSRRWIVQTGSFCRPVPSGFIERLVSERTGFPLDPKDKTWDSVFRVQHFIAETFHRGHVFLCGDAAHTMSPIGGQGMNTGFADAEFLAYILSHALDDPSLDVDELGKAYDHFRKIAARAAQTRAGLGMAVGTLKGIVFSVLRDYAIAIALRTPVARILLYMFTMLTIPYNSLAKVLAKDDILEKARGKMENSR